MTLLKPIILLVVILAVPAMALADGNARAGQAKAAACAACHGPDGNAPSGQYPDLAGQGAPYLVKQLQDFKSGKRANPIMQAMAANLSQQDMEDLAAWFAEQKAHTGKADPKLVQQGEKLFRGGDVSAGVPACSGCHNPAGQGLAAARFPRLAGQQPQYLESQLKAFRAAGRDDLGPNVVRRDNDPNKMMEAIAAKLSDRQIQALASFMSGLSLGPVASPGAAAR